MQKPLLPISLLLFFFLQFSFGLDTQTAPDDQEEGGITNAENVSSMKLEEALAFYKAKNYFMTEATLMGSQPGSDVELRALLLVHTAQKIGNLEEKTAFFAGYLDQEPVQRQLALLFRSWSFAFTKDWESFRGQAVSALLEVQDFPHDSNYLLLYCLARYTQQNPEDLALDACQRAWFDAVRAVPGTQRFPLSFQCENAPTFLMRLPFVATLADRDPRGWPSGRATSNDRLIEDLLEIDQLLVEGDLHAAAERFNAFDRGRLSPFPWDFQAEYQRLLARFFELNEEPERQAKAEERVRRLAKDFRLNFDCFQDDVKPKLVTHEKEIRIEVPRNIRSHRELEAVLGELDTDAFMGHLNALPSGSRYQQLYKTYLLGKFHLAHGRFQSAYTFISKAEAEAVTSPFAILESKILTAMGDYYLREKNLEQANWYWIASSQALASPEALCQLATMSNEDVDLILAQPFNAMIDAFLLKPDEDLVSSFLYAHQMRELLNARVHMYASAGLSENRVISNQLLEIGTQMANELEQLKKSPNYRLKNLSDLRELWDQLWKKVQPFYRDLSPLNLRALQAEIAGRDTLLILSEGLEQLGAAVISRDRAFVSYLGPKKAFSESLATVVNQQLGNVLDFNLKQGYLSLSSSYRTKVFLEPLAAQNPPGSFQVLFQLARIQSNWNRIGVSDTVVLYDRTFNDPERLNELNVQGIEKTIATVFDEQNRKTLVSDGTFLVYAGEVNVSDDGDIQIGSGAERVSLASLVQEHKLQGVGLAGLSWQSFLNIHRPLAHLNQEFEIPVVLIEKVDQSLVLPPSLRGSSWLIY